MTIIRTTKMIMFVSAMFIALPKIAQAEVMDKEPTIGVIWLSSIIGAIIGFLICRWRAWLVFLVLPLSLVVPGRTIIDIFDTYVGPAIIREAGYTYVIQTFMATLLVISGNAIGIYLSFKTRQ